MCKCADCGYLAVRNMETRQLEEVERYHRETGDVPKKRGTNDPIYNPAVCFARGDYIVYQEKEKVLAEMVKPRECKLFVRWAQGLTPKEHKEMLDEQWKLDQEKKSKKSDRIWHFIELIVTLVIGAVIAIVSAYISRGVN
jgi:hypothetical protein